MSDLKEKVEYQRGKVQAVEKDIHDLGFQYDPIGVIIQGNITVIRRLLIENGFITEEQFEMEYLKETELALKALLENCREQKKKMLTHNLLIPKSNIPKDLKIIKG